MRTSTSRRAILACVAGLGLATGALAADPAPAAPHAAPGHATDTSALAHDPHAPGAHVEHAAHGEHAGVLPTIEQGIVPMLVALGVFGIAFAILSLKVWPMINKGLSERADKIRNEIEAAEMAQQQAKAALEQYQRNLDEARAEAQRMLDQAKAQQQAIAAELKARSEADLAMMREKATRDIETAKRAALNEIYAEASNLATSIAGKILQREIGPQDQSRLVDQSLDEIRQLARV